MFLIWVNKCLQWSSRYILSWERLIPLEFRALELEWFRVKAISRCSAFLRCTPEPLSFCKRSIKHLKWILKKNLLLKLKTIHELKCNNTHQFNSQPIIETQIDYCSTIKIDRITKQYIGCNLEVGTSSCTSMSKFMESKDRFILPRLDEVSIKFNKNVI